jgi:hypothetical protein
VPASPEDIQEAVYELHQYLSDQRPPLMAVDSVALLLEEALPHVAEQIQAWVAGQHLTAPVSDYLFHAGKKIALLGDLDLVPKVALAGYLRWLTDALVPMAPDADREILRQNLDRLTQVAAPVMTSAGVIHRQSGVKAPPAPHGEQMLTREVRRLSVLLDHLRPLASPTAAPEQRTELTSQFLSAAAARAATAKDLDTHFAPLRQLGIDVTTQFVLRTLARSLAGWALPVVEGQTPVTSREQVQAMRQIVSLAEDATEVAKRFRELVHAATEQFNEGHLGRAATMFELAERLASEQKVKPMFIEPLRTQGHDYLDPERLRKCAERADYRPQLRVIMGFFNALRPAALLQGLNGEANRERRHQLLALLEAHEQASRLEAWLILKGSVEPGVQVDPFFQMNLVYLLRIIPRPADASVDDEVGAVMRAAGRSSPPPLVKQIIAYLASTRHEKAERALITYLKVFESMLLHPETAAYPLSELEVLLDRTCAGLARYGTPRAWRLLIDHGLKVESRLGSPFVRLSEAGRLDFSTTPDLVERIIAALRLELPKRGLMGMPGRKDEDKALSLIGALAGTPLPDVQAVLQEIADTYSDSRLGGAAGKALSALAAVGKPSVPPGLSGDLELFGLPNLLQTLAQSTFTGVLSLLNAEGKTQATLLVDKGELAGGQCGVVRRGDEAVYQLLERPFPGTFAFVSRPDLSGERVAPRQPFFPLLMEGVRRHDEFRRAAAVVPDTVRLKGTGKERTPLPDENADVAALIWREVAAGRTPQECEDRIGLDSYRVRRLLAHWVEEGVLEAA